jgi:hypothetical protein
MTDQHQTPPDGAQSDDADLAALLRAAGPRPQPPAAMADIVRAAVAAEWRKTVASRRPRRRATPWLAAAAVVGVAVVSTWLVVPRLSDGRDGIASVARLEGTVDVRHGSRSQWEPLTSSVRMRVDDVVRTSASGRIALRRADGLEVRLDRDTQLAFDDTDHAQLVSGRVYVDAGGAGASADAFTLETPLGEVRHLGTQYLASMRDRGLEIAVREGAVALSRGAQPVVAQAGERIAVGRDGSLVHSHAASRGEDWQWAESVSPGFDIKGRSLDEFLTWAARETGRRLVYASRDAANEAEATRLSGSVSGLNPDAAITAVLATAPSLRCELGDTQLVVERAAP